MDQKDIISKKIVSINNKYQFSPIRGLNRQQAASYIGISPTLFDDLVKECQLPSPFVSKVVQFWTSDNWMKPSTTLGIAVTIHGMTYNNWG